MRRTILVCVFATGVVLGTYALARSPVTLRATVAILAASGIAVMAGSLRAAPILRDHLVWGPGLVAGAYALSLLGGPPALDPLAPVVGASVYVLVELLDLGVCWGRGTSVAPAALRSSLVRVVILGSAGAVLAVIALLVSAAANVAYPTSVALGGTAALIALTVAVWRARAMRPAE